MRKLILLFILGIQLPVMAQEVDCDVRRVFKQMPDSLTPYLSQNNRLDLIDFMDAKMRAVVSNLLGGDTEMTYLSKDSLHIKMSEAYSISIKLEKADTSMVVRLDRTYITKKHQTEVLTSLYTPLWCPVSGTSVQSSLLKRDEEVFKKPYF